MTGNRKEPRVVLLGATGAGKSTLFNALLGGEYQRVGVTPTTDDVRPIRWDSNARATLLVDTPGAMEAAEHSARVDVLIDQLAEADVVVVVIGYPNRAVEWERKLVRLIREADANIPILVAATRIDLVNRAFDASKFSVRNGTTSAEQKVRDWSEYIEAKLHGAGADRLVVCSGGEHAGDVDRQYNLSELVTALDEAVPSAEFAARARADEVRNAKGKRASQIIYAASVAAAGAAAVPIPVADAVAISGIQGAMIMSLASLYGLELTRQTAAGLVGAAAAGVLGPMAVQQIVKLLPGVGSLIGPGVAGTVTLAMGRTFDSFFAKGNFEPTAAQIKKQMKRSYSEARKRRSEFEEKI